MTMYNRDWYARFERELQFRYGRKLGGMDWFGRIILAAFYLMLVVSLLRYWMR